ncbi:MAG: hypothetical protein KDD50_13855 [Bdellovibrionales bacterium]|nr:hypothetical protein [Bdellovibrionales bacterium]
MISLLACLFLLSSCNLNGVVAVGSDTSNPSNGSGGGSGVSCPSGYIALPSSVNTALGYSLCVAKYEMKVSQNDGTPVMDGRGSVALDPSLYKAVSRASGTPWTRILYSDAIAECSEIGTGYRLITNTEWNKIALDIESVADNWSGGLLTSGHTDGAIDTNAVADGWSYTGNLLAAGSDSDGYEGTGNTSAQAFGSGGEQRRTLKLSNGEIIWDMSGNAREKVDADGQGGTISYTGIGNFSELNSTDMSNVVSSMLSSNAVSFSISDFTPSSASYTHSGENIGMFYTNGGSNSLRILSRGGNMSSGNKPGLFAGDADEANTGLSSSGGFRCVYQTN